MAEKATLGGAKRHLDMDVAQAPAKKAKKLRKALKAPDSVSLQPKKLTRASTLMAPVAPAEVGPHRICYPRNATCVCNTADAAACNPTA